MCHGSERFGAVGLFPAHAGSATTGATGTMCSVQSPTAVTSYVQDVWPGSWYLVEDAATVGDPALTG